MFSVWTIYSTFKSKQSGMSSFLKQCVFSTCSHFIPPMILTNRMLTYTCYVSCTQATVGRKPFCLSSSIWIINTVYIPQSNGWRKNGNISTSFSGHWAKCFNTEYWCGLRRKGGAPSILKPKHGDISLQSSLLTAKRGSLKRREWANHLHLVVVKS